MLLQLRVFGSRSLLADAAGRLETIPGARHVVISGDGDPRPAMLTADLVDDAADHAMAEVRALGIAGDDAVLVRLDAIGPAAAARPLSTVVWADLLSQAGANARPIARYLVFMAAAGVIAAFGVMYANSTLIVGAMAISPDTLPIAAAATAFAVRRWRLAARAVIALAIGLGCACVVAGLLTVVLHTLELGPSNLLPDEQQFLGGLTTVNISTPIIAFAAGVAGMLALETRASAAVGVAISVTTIPASAYLGVAVGVGQTSKALGALAVLAVNISMLLVGGTLTLLVQARLALWEAKLGVTDSVVDGEPAEEP